MPCLVQTCVCQVAPRLAEEPLHQGRLWVPSTALLCTDVLTWGQTLNTAPICPLRTGMCPFLLFVHVSIGPSAVCDSRAQTACLKGKDLWELVSVLFCASHCGLQTRQTVRHCAVPAREPLHTCWSCLWCEAATSVRGKFLPITREASG